METVMLEKGDMLLFQQKSSMSSYRAPGYDRLAAWSGSTISASARRKAMTPMRFKSADSAAIRGLVAFPHRTPQHRSRGDAKVF